VACSREKFTFSGGCILSRRYSYPAQRQDKKDTVNVPVTRLAKLVALNAISSLVVSEPTVFDA
jgi:hypothetical protein